MPKAASPTWRRARPNSHCMRSISPNKHPFQPVTSLCRLRPRTIGTRTHNNWPHAQPRARLSHLGRVSRSQSRPSLKMQIPTYLLYLCPRSVLLGTDVIRVAHQPLNASTLLLDRARVRPQQCVASSRGPASGSGHRQALASSRGPASGSRHRQGLASSRGPAGSRDRQGVALRTSGSSTSKNMRRICDRDCKRCRSCFETTFQRRWAM